MSNFQFYTIMLCLGLVFGAILARPACAGPYVEAGIGKHGLNQSYWEGRDDIGSHFGFGYIWHYANIDLDLGFKHASQPALGEPFNDRPETTNDSVLLIIRYEWR